MKKDLIIIGAGSVGGHIASNLEEYSLDYNLLGFLDDDPSKRDSSFVGFPILGTVDQISNFSPEINIIVGIAFPLIKYQIVESLKDQGYLNFPSLISNAAWISKNVEIGVGCIIYPGTSINYNTNIGDFVVFNMNCAIGHDCKIGDNISFAPGVLLGGNTRVGNLTEVGIGAQSLQGVKVGSKSRIGAGTVIIKDIPDGATVVGNPGRILKQNNTNE